MVFCCLFVCLLIFGKAIGEKNQIESVFRNKWPEKVLGSDPPPQKCGEKSE